MGMNRFLALPLCMLEDVFLVPTLPGMITRQDKGKYFLFFCCESCGVIFSLLKMNCQRDINSSFTIPCFAIQTAESEKCAAKKGSTEGQTPKGSRGLD